MINALPANQTSTIATTEVTGALDAILSTDKFMASPQMSAFLRYVVEQTLIGNTRRIKAFTVGIEALGKPASFDPQTDPSVRVLAKRLRSSLDTYYTQNPDTVIFIEMKPGSYVPKFLRRSEMPVEMPVHVSASPMIDRSAYRPAEVTQSPSAPVVAPTENTANEPNSTASAGAERQGSSYTAQPHQPELGFQSTQEQSDDSGMRKTGFGQLWKAYKSASKVA